MLDIGRAHRLVTPAIRTALTLRDGGCAFPGCDTRPESCEAHHITPWWNGGVTALRNLVLLCHHHHGVIEPDRDTRRDQWTVHIDDNGAPVFTPPVRLRRLEERSRPPDDPVATGSDGVERQIALVPA